MSDSDELAAQREVAALQNALDEVREELAKANKRVDAQRASLVKRIAEVRELQVLAMRVLVTTKHGPGQSGRAGPCDEGCVKCMAEKVLPKAARQQHQDEQIHLHRLFDAAKEWRAAGDLPHHHPKVTALRLATDAAMRVFRKRDGT